MVPYMVGQLAPNSSHLTRGLVKYVSGRGYFRTVPSQNGDKIVTSPPPPPQSLNGSSDDAASLSGMSFHTFLRMKDAGLPVPVVLHNFWYGALASRRTPEPP